jgi:hypothetical protein
MEDTLDCCGFEYMQKLLALCCGFHLYDFFVVSVTVDIVIYYVTFINE